MSDLREETVFVLLLLQSTQYYSKTLLLTDIYEKVQLQRLQNAETAECCIYCEMYFDLKFQMNVSMSAVDNTPTKLCSSCSAVLCFCKNCWKRLCIATYVIIKGNANRVRRGAVSGIINKDVTAYICAILLCNSLLLYDLFQEVGILWKWY